MQDIIDKIRVASARSLTRLLGNALEISRAEIETQSGRHGESDVSGLADQSPATLQRFKQNFYANFARLDEAQKAAQRGTPSFSDEDTHFDEGSDYISLLDHDYIEAMIAMDSMVRAMREQAIPGMQSLQARLQSAYPDVSIDSTNNPLDPEQVGDCLNLAVRPLGLKAHALLTIYREFNSIVFANLGNVIEEVNQLLTVSEALPETTATADTEGTGNTGITESTEDNQTTGSKTYSPQATAQTVAQDPDPAEEKRFVAKKIQERVFDENMDPAIRSLLDGQLQDALLKILRSEGSEGKSWHAVMQNIDVMLWSIQPAKQDGDKERFLRIRDRLLSNIEKTLEFSETSKTKTRRALRQLCQIQDYSFLKAETQAQQPAPKILMSEHEPPALPPGDPFRIQSSRFPLGTRFEFQGSDGQPVRASLAVRIASVEKLIFSDSQGDKVLELSYDRLANALRNARVKVLEEPDGSA